MIDCTTLQEAQAVTDAVYIHFTGLVWRVYQSGDTVPIDPAPTAQDLLNALRVASKALIDAKEANDVRFRALVLVALDTFNRQSKQFRDLLAAVAAATSLADLKTRAGAITSEPARTGDDLKTAMRNKIDAGDAD